MTATDASTSPREHAPYVSARQRLVVLTFPSAEDAEEWDRAGRPLPFVEATA